MNSRITKLSDEILLAKVGNAELDSQGKFQN